MNQSTSAEDEALKSALANLALYTARGRELAENSTKLLDEVVVRAANEIRKMVDWLESSGMDDNQIRDYLTTQLEMVVRDLCDLPYEILEQLDALPDETFTISLFGRTTVGKSTLVSILTKGDASIIGNGSQQTTREAHPYTWKELRVIDVPGVSAVGKGNEDDVRVAFEAARPSDLIIFVISDSVQRDTAEHLAHIRSLGKPVICLVNIKAGREIRRGHEQEDINTLCRIINYKFSDKEKLQGLRNAVMSFDKEFSQEWEPMPFVYSHLRSAFLSQQVQYAPWKDKLLEASRFSDASNQICEEIAHRGCFIRLMSYINTVSSPLIETYEGLSRQSADSLTQLHMINDKSLHLKQWKEEFVTSCELQIETLITTISDELRAEADSFAEMHFNDKRASNQWISIVKGTESEKRANDLLSQFRTEASEKLRTLGREISIDLGLLRLTQMEHGVKPQLFVDKKRIWNRTMTATDIVLGAAALLTEAPALAIADAIAIGVQIIGDQLLKGEEHGRDNAIREFRKRLDKSIVSHGTRLRREMMKALRTQIVGAQIEDFDKLIHALYGGIVSLGTTQLELSEQLCNNINALNQSLVEEALSYDGNKEYTKGIVQVARIPDDLVVLVIKEDISLPQAVLDGLKHLLREEVRVVACRNGSVRLSQLIDNQASDVIVKYAGGKHVIAYTPTAHGNCLRDIRATMQLNRIVVVS